MWLKLENMENKSCLELFCKDQLSLKMQSVLVAVLAFVALIGAAIATPLDDYVWKKDDAYGWVDMVSLLQHLHLVCVVRIQSQ